MKFQSVPIEDALDLEWLKKHGIKYCLLYNLNKVELCTIDTIDFIDKDILIEARFFSGDKEVHAFNNGNGFIASMVLDEENPDSFTEGQILMKMFGQKLIVKNYIDYDDDNQAYIAYSRPCDFVGGEK